MICISKNLSTINYSFSSDYISIEIHKTRFNQSQLPKLIWSEVTNSYHGIYNLTDEKNFIIRSFKIPYKDLDKALILAKKHLGQKIFIDARKTARQFLYDLKRMPSYSNIPKVYRNKGYEIFQDFDDLCKDNFRMGRVGKSSDYRKYKREKNQGCCGFYDEIHTINGTKYYVGFNYGH